MDEYTRYQQYLDNYMQNQKWPVKIILSFYKGKALRLCRAAFFLMLQRTPVWILPLITARIVNTATRPGRDWKDILLWCLAIGATFIVQNVITNYQATKIYSRINRDIEKNLRNVLIYKLQHLSILFHKDIQTGRLQSKVMRDVENIQVLLDQIFKVLFFFVLDLTVIVVITVNNSPTVLVFFVVAAPVTVFAMALFRRPIQKNNTDFRDGMEKTQGDLAEMLQMIPVTRAHGLQNEEINRMNRGFMELSRRGYQLDVVNSIFGATSWVIFQLFQLICLAFTGYLACVGKISIGEVVLYQTYFGQLIGQISTLVNIYPQVCKGVESVRSIGDLLLDTKMEEDNSIIPLGELKGRVELYDVTFRYPDSDRKILDEFQVTVPAGESIAFVGESGSGKSTVLNMITGFLTPTEGKVLIDGINMKNLNMTEYRKQIAVVSQNILLFSGTIRDNITYGMKDVSDEEIRDVIEKVGLSDLLENMPDGLNTRLGEHGDRLSGGQKQRISIARALIRKPKIIVFDEATSALDPASEKKVQSATRLMMGQCTVFMVAHRLSTIKEADRIAVVEAGTIVEIGSYDELMEKKGNFYHMKAMQD